ncbi:TPA: hypothetical protein ACIV23_001769 [Salmonella enterica subsp. enterica serovar Java]|nr:hypothetical protein [Salmonella enterica]ECI6342598.1 hypothetical protein [Salmonella enterica subsp. enterica]ECI6797862.1 hypothetical protein [Salmonella enterica subsp. enterica serovar Paratyphi B]ECT8660333.1 hypothetical protein [Salmonella enterica subsp. enterica serovar Java]EGS5247465.1 hypothetical protein [Salmonella enterica subsp. enterica serovar 4,5,12:b:-]
MCNCIKQIGEKIEARLMEKVPDNSEISRGFDTGWNGTVLNLSSGRLMVNMTYKLAYRAVKKNGELAKNKTHMDCSVAMAYCPFCGEKMGVA